MLVLQLAGLSCYTVAGLHVQGGRGTGTALLAMLCKTVSPGRLQCRAGMQGSTSDGCAVLQCRVVQQGRTAAICSRACCAALQRRVTTMAGSQFRQA